MNWSNIAKNNNNNNNDTIIVTEPITKPIIENNTDCKEDDYNILYDLKFSHLIDDMYHDITEISDKRSIHILDNRNTNRYLNFYNLIYNNTEMIYQEIEEEEYDDEIEN